MLDPRTSVKFWATPQIPIKISAHFLAISLADLRSQLSVKKRVISQITVKILSHFKRGIVPHLLTERIEISWFSPLKQYKILIFLSYQVLLTTFLDRNHI